MEWKSAVAFAIASGWTREETVERVSFAERYPVDVGQEYMMSCIQTLNAGSLYDKLTAIRASPSLPASDRPRA
jgi:cyclase